MLKNKKLVILFALVVLIGGAGGAYMTILKPKAVTAKGGKAVKKAGPKIDGKLVPLTDPFTVNLAGGHYGRLSVSLLMTSAPAPTTNSSGGTSVILPENDAVRAVITNDLTGITVDRLVQRPQREKLLKQILKDLKKSTDEPVTEVMFTDLAVQ